MIRGNRKHPRIGQDSWFSRFETTPGAIDPRTGRPVQTTAVAERGAPGWFSRFETTPGYVDPRTGRFVQPTALGPRPAALPAPPAAPTARPRPWEPGGAYGAAPILSGTRRGNPNSSAGIGIFLLAGLVTFVVLEAAGVTHIVPRKA